MESKKIINGESIGNLIQEATVTNYFEFFRMNVLEVIQQRLAEDYEDNLTEEDIDEIADYVSDTDEIFDFIDNVIHDEIEKYKTAREESNEEE